MCFIDMDGVLADFLGDAFRLHNHSNPYNSGLVGEVDLVTYLGLRDRDQFFKDMDFEFWANLPTTAYCHDIISAIYSKIDRRDTAILSSPAKHPNCIAGKLEWINRHVPFYSNRYVFAHNKYFCAGEHKMLIDDFERNVVEFIEAGGEAFLLPTLWNSRYAEVNDAIPLLTEFLDKCLIKFGSVSIAENTAQ